MTGWEWGRMGTRIHSRTPLFVSCVVSMVSHVTAASVANDDDGGGDDAAQLRLDACTDQVV